MINAYELCNGVDGKKKKKIRTVYKLIEIK